MFSASLLGAIAGGVDAAGWFCLAGLLPSHLTASLVMLGARATEYDAAEVRARVAMLPVFVCTVALVKWSARWMAARRLPVLPVLLTFLTVGLALFCIAGSLSDALLADDPRVLLLLGGLGVASMAVQNAIMRLCLHQLCPTTVMTGNLTQLVMAGVDLLAHREPDRDARTRLVSAGTPLLGFVLGSVSCGYLASRQGLICLLIPLALSLGITVRAWRRYMRERQPTLFGVLGVPSFPRAG
ncbi:MAG: YoaK family protein [Polyangiales bacterium]